MICRTVFVLSLAFAPIPALAQMIEGDAQRGRALAVQDCSSCHAIEAHPSPGEAEALSFRAIAAMPSTTPAAIAAFLSTPHPNMPNYKLSRDEIRDVSAYIMTLRQR
ncbi:MAG TPA: cytochrome c [Rhodopila sp.]|uniref:c-type cytochrome n=1 Tax=Rhodopila sp. TaxID=2480087 RepID=UPI002CC46782|nr:cytochrome c [Rhodopila sp.]HVY15358.1 cytochrome c [Rhodopila sp.]